MPISGLLAEYSWPSIFYVFGLLGVIWSLAFLWTVSEGKLSIERLKLWSKDLTLNDIFLKDPQSSPKISEKEKNFINTALWGNGSADKSPEIPWKSIAKSMPFYAILFAHVIWIFLFNPVIFKPFQIYRWPKTMATNFSWRNCRLTCN